MTEATNRRAQAQAIRHTAQPDPQLSNFDLRISISDVASPYNLELQASINTHTIAPSRRAGIGTGTGTCLPPPYKQLRINQLPSPLCRQLRRPQHANTLPHLSLETHTTHSRHQQQQTRRQQRRGGHRGDRAAMAHPPLPSNNNTTPLPLQLQFRLL